MPQFDIELHSIAAEINVAIFQAQFFIGQNRIAGEKLRLFGFVQNAQLLCDQFYFAGADVLVYCVWLAQLNRANRSDHVFVAQLSCFLVQRGIVFFVEYDLSNSRAIPNVDKNQISQIAPAVHPAHEHSFLFCIRCAQCAAHVSPPQIAEEVEQVLPFN